MHKWTPFAFKQNVSTTIGQVCVKIAQLFMVFRGYILPNLQTLTTFHRAPPGKHVHASGETS